MADSDIQEDDNDRDELVRDITPEVLGVLKQERFFELLDDQFCPSDDAAPLGPAKCGHSFDVTKLILRNLGMDSDDIEDVVDVLHSQGACCDCEVLYNVAEESRLKARYWKARYREIVSETEKANPNP